MANYAVDCAKIWLAAALMHQAVSASYVASSVVEQLLRAGGLTAAGHELGPPALLDAGRSPARLPVETGAFSPALESPVAITISVAWITDHVVRNLN